MLANMTNTTKTIILAGAAALLLLVGVFVFSGGKDYTGTPCAGLEASVCQEVDSITFKSEEGWLIWTVEWDNGDTFNVRSRDTANGQRFKASMDTYITSLKAGDKVYYHVAPKTLFGGNLTELDFQFAPGYSSAAGKHVEGFLRRR